MEFENLETNNEPFKPWGIELNTFCMLMHLSQYSGYIVPLAGWVLPIVMWTTNKDKSELVNQHGINILNWMISSLIYAIIGLILLIIVIGVFWLIALFIVSLIFTIIGAIKASNGEVYKYPLSITFIRE